MRFGWKIIRAVVKRHRFRLLVRQYDMRRRRRRQNIHIPLQRVRRSRAQSLAAVGCIVEPTRSMIRRIANIIAAFDRRRHRSSVRHCNPAIPRARIFRPSTSQNKRSYYPEGGFWATNWQLVCARRYGCRATGGAAI